MVLEVGKEEKKNYNNFLLSNSIWQVQGNPQIN